VQHLNLVSFAEPQNHLQLNKNSVCACSYIYANSKYHFPYSSFFQTGLPTFILACLSFHSFPQTFQHQSPLCCICLQHHLALTASASQPLNSGTLSLYLSVPAPVLIPSVVTSRPTTASRPSNPLNPSPLAPQIRPLLTIVCVYKLYLLAYLQISKSTSQ